MSVPTNCKILNNSLRTKDAYKAKWKVLNSNFNSHKDILGKEQIERKPQYFSRNKKQKMMETRTLKEGNN